MSNLVAKVSNYFLCPPVHLDRTQSKPVPPVYPLTPSRNALQPVTIIELFQSQGCNSCPPANKFLITRASSSSIERSRPNSTELLLTYEVTYWDYLGWTDTFGDTRWDVRQTAYARAMRQRSCYTPQVIIDGGATPMENSSWRDVDAVLTKAEAAKEKALSTTIRVEFERVNNGEGLKISGKETSAIVLAVFYEVEPKPVRILRGENRGLTEKYSNVVRDLHVLGMFEGGESVLELPARRKGFDMAVLVQADDGGPILGAVRV